MVLEEKEQQLDDILSSFRCINHNFQQLLWKDAEELQITSTQLMVLRKLAMHPDIGITELADLLHLGNSAASGVVDRMVKAGLITRQRSQSDRMYIQSCGDGQRSGNPGTKQAVHEKAFAAAVRHPSRGCQGTAAASW